MFVAKTCVACVSHNGRNRVSNKKYTARPREQIVAPSPYHHCNDVDDTANRKSKIAQEVWILHKGDDRLDEG